MAIDSILSSLEAGIAEGRKDALARQQLEQQQQQAAQSQANNDRTYQLSVLNSMIGLQASMPKAEPQKDAARKFLAGLDQAEMTATVSGQYENPQLLAQIQQAGAILGDEGAWVHRMAGNIKYDPASVSARKFRTSTRGWGAEAVDSFHEAVATGSVEQWATANEIPLTEARHLSALALDGNGLDINTIREMKYDELLRDKDFLSGLDAMDQQIASAGATRKDSDKSAILLNLSRGITALESNPIVMGTTRGQDLYKKYLTARGQVPSMAMQTPEDQTPSATEMGDAWTRHMQATLTNGGAISSDAVKKHGETAITLARNYLDGTLDKGAAALSGNQIVGVLLDAKMIKPEDVSTLTRTLGNGNPQGPMTLAAGNDAIRAYRRAKETYSAAASGATPDTDPQPLYVMKTVAAFNANVNGIEKYTEDLLDYAKDPGGKLGKPGLAAIIDAADQSSEPDVIKATAEIVYMAGKGEHRDDIATTIEDKYPGIMEKEAIETLYNSRRK